MFINLQLTLFILSLSLTHSLWKFYRKKLFETRLPVFWSVCSQKNQICPKRLQVDHFLMPKCSFESSGMRKSYIVRNCPPGLLLFSFFPRFFLVGHLLSFISLRKVFLKSPGIVKLFWRNYEGIVGKEFHLEFSGQSFMFFGVCVWPVWLNTANWGFARSRCQEN